MSIDVLALVRLTPERRSALQAAGYAVREGTAFPSRTEALRDAAATARAVLTNGRFGLSGAEMALLPKLAIVCAVGAGFEAIDLDTARSRGIAVTHTPDRNAPAVADSAIMLLMAAVRRLPQADRFVRSGGWQDQWRAITPTVSGKRLGILGLGKIGGRIAYRAARGFDMEVGYHNRAAVAGAPYRYFDRLVDLASWADFLIVAAPGGPHTRHLVDAQVLAALGPQGYLVNVGRGTVVDTAALIEALQSNRIAGAGLDVVEGEPAIPQRLLDLDNLVITPHCAGRAPETQAAATALIIDNLNAHFAGRPLLTPIPI